MDYSSQIPQLNRAFFINFGFSLLCICMMIGFFFFIKKIKVNPEFFPNNYDKWNTIVRWISCIGLIVLLAFSIPMSVRFFLDIPNIRSNAYIVDVCEITKQDAGGADNAVQNRGVWCKNKLDVNIPEYHLLVSYTPLRQGEKYRVIYLQNSKYGVIIERMP